MAFYDSFLPLTDGTAHTLPHGGLIHALPASFRTAVSTPARTCTNPDAPTPKSPAATWRHCGRGGQLRRRCSYRKGGDKLRKSAPRERGDGGKVALRRKFFHSFPSPPGPLFSLQKFAFVVNQTERRGRKRRTFDEMTDKHFRQASGFTDLVKTTCKQLCQAIFIITW